MLSGGSGLAYTPMEAAPPSISPMLRRGERTYGSTFSTPQHRATYASPPLAPAFLLEPTAAPSTPPVSRSRSFKSYFYRREHARHPSKGSPPAEGTDHDEALFASSFAEDLSTVLSQGSSAVEKRQHTARSSVPGFRAVRAEGHRHTASYAGRQPPPLSPRSPARTQGLRQPMAPFTFPLHQGAFPAPLPDETLRPLKHTVVEQVYPPPTQSPTTSLPRGREGPADAVPHFHEVGAEHGLEYGHTDAAYAPEALRSHRASIEMIPDDDPDL